MNPLKIVLALLLLLCLFDMPYGYYTFMRIMGMCGFGLLAWLYYKQKNELNCIIFALLTILFQPFVKITLDRGLWSVIDVIVAIFLLILAGMSYQKGRNKKKQK